MGTGKILLGVLAGVAVGATLGILFAPDKGANTRKKIVKKGDDYADDLKEKFQEFVENMTEKYENVKEEASNLVEKAKNKAEELEAMATAKVNSKN